MRRPRAVVLMYHRVATPAVDPWFLAVDPARFDEQIEALASEFDVIPLRDVPAYVGGGPTQRSAVAITFDDGYRDNLRVARPILERRRCPATFFIPTGYVGTGEGFWWDELATQALTAKDLPPEIVLQRGSEPLRWTPADGEDRAALLDLLWRHFRGVPHEERPLEMNELGKIFGKRAEIDDDSQPITAAEVNELAGPLFEIGAHSVTHPAMSSLPQDRQLAEAWESREGCEAILGQPVTSFAYPFGAHDDNSVEAVRKAGCTIACTTNPGVVTHRSDVLRLPRLQVENWTGEELCARIVKLIKNEPVAWWPGRS